MDDFVPKDDENLRHVESQAIKIGFIGFPRSGKTMTVLVLDRALRKSRWNVFPADDITNDFIEPLQDDLLMHGKLPPFTVEHTQLTFKADKRAGFWGFDEGLWPPILIKFLEAPGADSLAGLVKAGTDENLRYIAQCSGVLFLLDPQEAVKSAAETEVFDYDRVFSRIFTRLNQYKPTRLQTSKIYFALCLTKMDMFSDSWDNPEEKAKTILGETAMENLYKFCRNPHIEHKWFSTSAVGFRQEDHIITSRLRTVPLPNGNVHQEVVRPENLEPEGIKEAVEWILGKIQKETASSAFLSRWKRQ